MSIKGKHLELIKIYESLIDRGYNSMLDIADELEETLNGSIYVDEIYALADKQGKELRRLVNRQFKELKLDIRKP